MVGFFFSFTFKSKMEVTYFLPLKLLTNDREIANKFFQAMKTAISSRYSILSETTPIIIVRDINDQAIDEIFKRTIHGKVVKLRASEWGFINFEPNLELSFNVNLGKACNDKIQEIEEVGIPINGSSIARFVREHRFPVQVLSYTEKWQENEFLAIELVSVT